MVGITLLAVGVALALDAMPLDGPKAFWYSWLPSSGRRILGPDGLRGPAACGDVVEP